MARAAVRAVLAVFAVWLSGCGTTVNLIQPRPYPEGPEVYGGVADAAKSVREWATQVSERSRKGDFWGCCATAACCVISSVDLPASAVGDTLTLPITILFALEKPSQEPAHPASRANRDLDRHDGAEGDDAHLREED